MNNVFIRLIIFLILFVFSKAKSDLQFSSQTQEAKTCDYHCITDSTDDCVCSSGRTHLLYTQSVEKSINEIIKASRSLFRDKTISKHLQGNTEEPVLPAMETCRGFLSLAMDSLKSSLPSAPDVQITYRAQANFRTWLSAALGNVQACIDIFRDLEIRKSIGASHLDNSTRLITASLSILSQIDDHENNAPGEVPTPTLQFVNGKPQPNVVVAADGSGNHTTISEAIQAVPSMSNTKFVIYVKTGVYMENVVVPRDKRNVVMYGDGTSATIVTGNRSTKSLNSPDVPATATFNVIGNGFIAMYMTFQNSGGPAGGQAVALLSMSDQSAFYRCRIDGFQDTLWTRSNRQFYRECKILGTVDFIYGDAAVVIQDSALIVKRPRLGQYNIITAQGKSSPETNSGLSIQNCQIMASGNLNGVKTYLGRPWMPYSTTIITGSQLGGFIEPEGWIPWTAFTTAPNTIFYVEYNNSGPGAAIGGRVKWKGLHNTAADASRFTVQEFINGDQWLPAAGIPFRRSF